MDTAKLADTRSLIARTLAGAQHPRILCSFGKDSVSLLSLLASHRVRSVLHAQGPDELVDPAYVALMTRLFDLDVRFLPRGRAVLFFVGHQPLVLCLLHVNPRVLIPFPLTLSPHAEGEPFVCLDEELRASHGTTLEEPCDVLFMGQKSSDFLAGSCQIWQRFLPADARAAVVEQAEAAGPVVRIGDLTVVRPLLAWTDADVWAFLTAEHLPTSSLMYDGQRRRHYAARACYRCHDPYGPTLVECPRLGQRLTNLAALAQDADLRLERLTRLGLMAPEHRVAIATADPQEWLNG